MIQSSTTMLLLCFYVCLVQHIGRPKLGIPIKSPICFDDWARKIFKGPQIPKLNERNYRGAAAGLCYEGNAIILIFKGTTPDDFRKFFLLLMLLQDQRWQLA